MRNEGGVDLSQEELAAVSEAVRALVTHDRDALEAIGAYADGVDPYLWTRDYGPWEQVTLQVPPGPPESWDIDALRYNDGSGYSVNLAMFTAEEGPSELTLELSVTVTENGQVAASFEGLHVL